MLTVETWQSVLRRDIAPRIGRPVVGVDLGEERSWSSAVAVFPNGRVECVAACGGLPSLEEQEKRDGSPPGAYQRLADSGQLVVASGLHVPPVPLLMDLIRGWKPRALVADRFKRGKLVDAKPPCRVFFRVARWSESTEDISALRQFALDLDMNVAAGSRALLQHSLGVSRVKTDDGGSVRLVKHPGNRSRDDVVAALILAAGLHMRLPARVDRPKFSLVG